MGGLGGVGICGGCGCGFYRVFEDEVGEDGDGGGEGWDDEFAGVHGDVSVDWSWVKRGKGELLLNGTCCS